MANKLPAILLYVNDWLSDPVAGCSLEAQGLWLRMMFIAHFSERYGYLSTNGAPTPSDLIARRCGTTPENYATLLAELDAAGVPSRTPEGIIYSRRMVNDEKKRVIARRNGKKGGNPTLKGLVIRQDNQSIVNGDGTNRGKGCKGKGSRLLAEQAEALRTLERLKNKNGVHK